jgi:NADH-quinone oxidoreductase subunit G
VENVMATVYIDGKAYEVDSSRNMLDVALNLGFDLPYFCWHPAMGSVGACRQCAVKQFRDESDTRGRLVMACMTPAAPNTRISIFDADARLFRKGVIEGLMMSHPHDCPVCDEGGECHLQDMTVMTGHDYRRYRFPKRTFRNQYLGPLVNHEMNRCIQCYRCVRFYRDYAGGRDLNAFALRNIVFFGRHEDGVLENEFSGNLVEVCPTGVFTDATLKQHYTRKWDLQFAPSVCAHCGLGCNTSPGERYGLLRRIVNRYNGDVNGYFLCDRGRYGYEFVNSDRRLRSAVWDKARVSREHAIAHAGELLKGADAIGIGSPRASLESNFALRTLVGRDRFFAGMADGELRLVRLMIDILRAGPARTPSLREIEECDAVLVLGEDVMNTAPRMALSLWQASRQQPLEAARKLKIDLWNDAAVRELVQNEKGPLFVATPNATRLDEIATNAYRGAPDDIARMGFAVAHAIDGAAPGEAGGMAEYIAGALKAAKRPLVVSGPSLGSEAVIQAAANVARALARAGRPAALSFTAPEPNSVGLAMMGARPLGEALRAAADAVVVLENDLYRRAPEADIDTLLARTVIALDSVETRVTEKATAALPAATFAESDGTFVNNEGRVQRFFQVFVPQQDVAVSWRSLRELMMAAGREDAAQWRGLDDVIAAFEAVFPELGRAVREAAPPASFRMAGMKEPRQPLRYTGRTAMLANIAVSEPKPPEDPDSPLKFSMEGYPKQPPPSITPYFWAPGWNSIQSLNKFQEEIAGPLRGGNPGVRTIEPAGDTGAYFELPPRAFELQPGEWLAVPLYHIFGSEELSRLAPALASLAPAAYLALNPEDARAIGERAELELDGTRRVLPVREAPDLPPGLAGVPAGFPETAGLALPARCRVRRAA